MHGLSQRSSSFKCCSNYCDGDVPWPPAPRHPSTVTVYCSEESCPAEHRIVYGHAGRLIGIIVC